MRPPVLPLLGIFSLGLCQPVLSAEPLAAVLPAKSIFFLNISNLSNLRESMDHSLLKPLTTGKAGEALKPLLEKLKGEVSAQTDGIMKEETGLTTAEVLAKFPGEAAASMSLSVAEAMKAEPGATPKGGVALLMDYTGDEALMGKIVVALDKLEEKMESELADKVKDAADDDEEEDDAAEPEKDAEPEKPSADWPADYEEEIVDASGAKLHKWTVKDPEKFKGLDISWCVTGGKAAIFIGDVEAAEVIGRVVKPNPEGSLATTAAWKSLPDTLSAGDLIMGANLEYVLAEVQEGIRLKMDKGEMNTGLPINPLQVWTGLGLDQFRAAFFITDLQAGEAAVHIGTTYQEMPAILKLYAANGPGTAPDFVPADVQEISWGTFDWGKMFDNLKEVATAVSPMAAGGMETGLAELKKSFGVDLRADILGQMGDGLWSVSTMDMEAAAKAQKAAEAASEDEDDDAPQNPFAALAMMEGQAQVLGIALRDAKAFELSLKTIFNTAAPGQALFEDREFMGVTIHQIKGAPENMPLAWLIHKDNLLVSIGKMELLDKVLMGMAKRPTNPLINEPHLKAAFAALPEGGVSSSYMNAGQLVDILLAAFKQGMEAELPDEAAEMLKNFPDELNLPWYTVSRLYITGKSADVRIRLAPKP